MAVFTVPPDMPLTVAARLVAAGASGPDRWAALSVLSAIVATLQPQSYSTGSRMRELTEALCMDEPTFQRGLRWLATVEAVQWTRYQGDRRLGIIPPGARLPGRPRAYESRVA